MTLFVFYKIYHRPSPRFTITTAHVLAFPRTYRNLHLVIVLPCFTSLACPRSIFYKHSTTTIRELLICSVSGFHVYQSGLPLHRLYPIWHQIATCEVYIGQNKAKNSGICLHNKTCFFLV